MPATTRLERKTRKIQEQGIDPATAAAIAEKELAQETSIDLGNFTSRAERRLAESLLSKYLSEYEIVTVADKNALQQLIYLEVLHVRLQEKLDDMYSKDIKAIPQDIVYTMHQNSTAILKIKDTLGLNRAKQEKLGFYDAMAHLQRRFGKWLESNQASRTIKCPHCQEHVLLKMRTEAWEALKHPWFKDNMIYNQHLFNNYGRKVTINDEFIAACLGTSKDYISWMIAKTQPAAASVENTNSTVAP